MYVLIFSATGEIFWVKDKRGNLTLKHSDIYFRVHTTIKFNLDIFCAPKVGKSFVEFADAQHAAGSIFGPSKKHGFGEGLLTSTDLSSENDNSLLPC